MAGQPAQGEGSQHETQLDVFWKKLAGETSTSPFPERQLQQQQRQNPAQVSGWNRLPNNELQHLHSRDQSELDIGFQNFVGPNTMASSISMTAVPEAPSHHYHGFFGWSGNNMETVADRDRQPGSSSCLSELMDIDAAGFDSSYLSFTQCLQAGLQMGEADYSALSRSLGVARESGQGRQPIINDPELNPREYINIEESTGRSSPAASAPPFHDFDPSSIMMAEEQAGGHMGEISNVPTTPNSSISSSSTEAANEDPALAAASVPSAKRPPPVTDPATDTQDKPSPESKKPSRPRKKGQKRNREPRFAFMTKSDVDQLEDGYRWRKYGQKAVKNSPYPRSYYRCTNTKCSVKKRVERSFEDPTIVITTYEGQHTHQSPALLRGGSGADQAAHLSDRTNISSPMPPAFTFPLQMMLQVPPRTNLDIDQQQQQHPPSMFNIPLHAPDHHHTIPHPPPPPHSAPLQQIRTQTDRGLLEDIVPSAMRNFGS